MAKIKTFEPAESVRTIRAAAMQRIRDSKPQAPRRKNSKRA